MNKICFEELEDKGLPQVLKTIGSIEIYSINKNNFEVVVKIFEDLYGRVKDKDIEKESDGLQVIFIKKIFPIMTNIDMSGVTDAKIKKIIKSPSADMGEVLVFLYKYMGQFMEDFTKFNEKISEMPKKDFDILINTKSKKDMIEIFEKNNFIEDEFVIDFTDKYLK